MSAVQAGTPEVVAIGEGQLRLDTAVGTPLQQADSLAVNVAGTEGNVLGLLARLGHQTALVSSLPESPIGQRVAAQWQEAGIDLSRLVWRPDGRVALYFVEQASTPIPTRVFYDRKASCFAQLDVVDIDWGFVSSARMIHLSGITAGLTENTLRVVNHAAKLAGEHGLLLSVDVNYRSQLWSAATASTTMTPLLAQADIVFCSRRDAANLFQVGGEAPEVAKTLADRFEAGTVLVSDGPRPAHVISNGETFGATPPATTIVDRIGAGDALIGGFLHGYLTGSPAEGLRLGVAAAALALTRHGDQVHIGLAELRALADHFAAGEDIIR